MSGVKLRRVDAELSDALKGESNTAENDALCKLFQKASGNEGLKVSLQSLKDTAVHVLLNIPEEFRRMQDTMRMYQLAQGEDSASELPPNATLVLNTASALIGRLSALTENDGERAERLASYLWKLSLLSLRKLSAAEMQSFLADSYQLLDELAK